MQSLNSVGYARKAIVVTGMGMFIAFLFLAPFAAFAASAVTLTTDKTFYAGTATINVSGTVTPAPGVNGTSVAITINGPTGAPSPVDVNQFLVNGATGAYSGTFTTGGPNYKINGTYTLTANYGGGTASASFQYGNITTATSGTGTTTTVQVTTTVISIQQTTVTQVNNVATTVTSVQQQQTTTTQVVNSQTTVTLSPTTDGTALAVGAVGVIIAIVAVVLAVLTMRKK